MQRLADERRGEPGRELADPGRELLAHRARRLAGHAHAVDPTESCQVEPPAALPWVFPDPRDAEDDLVGVGADLAPGTLLAAYRRGIFPMPEHGARPPMHWFSPVHRGIVPLDGLVVSRSLRRSCRDFEIRVDTAFDEVVAGCGDPARDAGWITRDIAAAYGELHRLGWAHSVEAWRDGELAGGLYGVGDRRAVRGRVDVPPGPRRVEGGAGRRWSR